MMSTIRRRKPTRRPYCELLEGRIVLSTVVATYPAAGAVLANSPAAFRVTFDSPIDPFSLNLGDIVIDRVADDGSLTPAYDPSLDPAEQLDDSGTQASASTLRLALSPGHYRLVVPATSGMAGLDGALVANADGTNLSLADFTVARPGIGLSDAVALGAIGPSPVAVAGKLDFTTNPSAVNLYQITLPAGHFYRLGAEVSAQRDGSPLDAALTLFDARGNAISSDDLGRPDAPNDPFLFAGVKPGTYYLGVSGSGDLPGLPGGYNLQARTPGPQQTSAGGAFTLHLVADTADVPGALIGFSVQHADPLDPTPTGFTVRFSTPLDLGSSGSTVFDRSTAGVDLVDQNGRAWPVAAVNYDAQHAGKAPPISSATGLPQGRYTLHGWTPSILWWTSRASPRSRPPCPRVFWRTSPSAPISRCLPATPRVPWPSRMECCRRRSRLGGPRPPHAQPRPERSGPARSPSNPARRVAFRFVSLYQDYYKISVNAMGADRSTSVSTAATLPYLTIDPGLVGQDNTALANLTLGQHLLHFTATGDAAVTITVKIGIGAFSWDSLLANGLGQGPALNLEAGFQRRPGGLHPRRHGDHAGPCEPLGPLGTGRRPAARDFRDRTGRSDWPYRRQPLRLRLGRFS